MVAVDLAAREKKNKTKRVMHEERAYSLNYNIFFFAVFCAYERFKTHAVIVASLNEVF